MASKGVADRDKAVKSLVEVVPAQIEKVKAGFIAEMGPEQGAIAAEAAATLAIALLAHLANRAATMEAADNAHEAELADDGQYLDAREEARDSLLSLLVDLVNLMQVLFGPRGPESVGIDGRIGRQPKEVLRQARVTAPLVKGKAPQNPTHAKVKWDGIAEAAELVSAADALDHALKQVSREERERDVTQLEKDEAIAAYDDAFTRGANLLEAIFRLAGEGALADRVRPSLRRPGRLRSDEENAAATGTAAAQEPTPPAVPPTPTEPTTP